MIKGIGVDITSIERFDLNHRHFIERILTKNEVECLDALKSTQAKKEYLASRFAAKEAFLKANHVGLGAISFQEIEVMNTKEGQPFFTNSSAHLSISHDGGFAIAFVVLED